MGVWDVNSTVKLQLSADECERGRTLEGTSFNADSEGVLWTRITDHGGLWGTRTPFQSRAVQ